MCVNVFRPISELSNNIIDTYDTVCPDHSGFEIYAHRYMYSLDKSVPDSYPSNEHYFIQIIRSYLLQYFVAPPCFCVLFFFASTYTRTSYVTNYHLYCSIDSLEYETAP